MKELELRCSECSTFLRIRPKGTIITEIVCPKPKCKFVNEIKLVNSNSSDRDIRFKFDKA